MSKELGYQALYWASYWKDVFEAGMEKLKAEAIKDFVEKANKIFTEIYNKHIFGANDLEAEEKEAIMNLSDDVTRGFYNLVEEMIGAQE